MCAGAVSDPSRSDLEAIHDRLEQVEAILAYAGAGSRRLVAVRALLQDYKAENMPTRDARERWVAIIEAVLKLDRGATDDHLRDLCRQVADLRGMIHAYRSNLPS